MTESAGIAEGVYGLVVAKVDRCHAAPRLEQQVHSKSNVAAGRAPLACGLYRRRDRSQRYVVSFGF